MNEPFLYYRNRKAKTHNISNREPLQNPDGIPIRPQRILHGTLERRQLEQFRARLRDGRLAGLAASALHQLHRVLEGLVAAR